MAFLKHVIFWLLIPLITCDYQVTLELVKFADETDSLDNGNKCDGFFGGKCDPVLTICIDRSNGGCSPTTSLGSYTNTDMVEFATSGKIGDWTNPTVLVYTGTYEPAYIHLSAKDSDFGGSQNMGDIILPVSQSNVPANGQSQTIRGTSTSTTLDVTVTVQCIGSSSGPDCASMVTTTAASTTMPAESTTLPSESTTMPAESTTMPAESTTMPAESTTMPAESTTMSSESTTMPAENTTMPAESTTMSAESTTMPAESTTMPAESTTMPAESTTMPAESTTMPAESTTMPAESTTMPSESTTMPAESTTMAAESTTMPAESTTMPAESTTMPAESTTMPAESTTTSVQCMNGGSSIDGKCLCSIHYTGTHCERMICINEGDPNANGSKCICTPPYSGQFCEIAPKSDCEDLLQYSHIDTSGVYQIDTKDNGQVDVYCDMSNYGGGWTSIQTRMDDTDFDRSWNDYRTGFGVKVGSYWLGNDIISELTNQNDYQLLIELENCNGDWSFQIYDSFMVGGESSMYELSVGPAKGSAGDAINFPGASTTQNKMKFSTFDQDNDQFPVGCSNIYSGGWWFNACGLANLNGKFSSGCSSTSRAPGILWYTVNYEYYSFRSAKMMIRPANTTLSF